MAQRERFADTQNDEDRRRAAEMLLLWEANDAVDRTAHAIAYVGAVRHSLNTDNDR